MAATFRLAVASRFGTRLFSPATSTSEKRRKSRRRNRKRRQNFQSRRDRSSSNSDRSGQAGNASFTKRELVFSWKVGRLNTTKSLTLRCRRNSRRHHHRRSTACTTARASLAVSSDCVVQLWGRLASCSAFRMPPRRHTRVYKCCWLV